MPDEPLIVTLRSGGRRPPLWLLHPLGGSMLFAARFVSRFERDQPVLGIQARGLDGRRAPFTSLGEAAAHYLELVRASQPSGPYYLAGPSFGGNLAFEMAQQLRARGAEVRLLALLDAHGPNFPRPAAWPVRLKVKLLGLGQRLDVLAMARIPEDGEDETVRNLRRVALAHEQALATYRPAPYAGRVHLFRAATPPDWPGVRFDEPTNGWGPLVRGGLEVIPVPGTHQFLMDPPWVDTLASSVSSVLTQAQNARPARGRLDARAP